MTDKLDMDTKSLFNLLVQANELRRQEDYQAALTVYLDILAQEGGSPDLLAMIARCYYLLALHNPHETGSNDREAIAWIERAIALAPDDARLHADLAEYYWLGIPDYERSAQEYRKALLLNPNNIWALRGASWLYGVPEDVVTLEEAIGWLERAILLDPQDLYSFFNLGYLYRRAGRRSDAERVWRRALLEAKPLDPELVKSINWSLAESSAKRTCSRLQIGVPRESLSRRMSEQGDG